MTLRRAKREELSRLQQQVQRKLAADGKHHDRQQDAQLFGLHLDPDPRADLGTDPSQWEGRVNRNAPCPCGSGLKYKHCHGAVTA